jgi:hypothetical protein
LWLQTQEGADEEKEITEDTQDYNRKGVLFEPHHFRHALRGGAPRQGRGTTAASDTSGGSDRSRLNGTQDPCGLTPIDQSVWAPNINNLPLDKMLKVAVMVVQQIMRESNGAVLEETEILTVREIGLNLMAQNGH